MSVGDQVVAIGNPFGLERSMTAGSSARSAGDRGAERATRSTTRSRPTPPINPGNSGGPLLDTPGRGDRREHAIQTGGAQGNVGVGFAIPVDTVKSVTAQIIRVGKVEHAFLGVEATRLTEDIARLFA